MSVTSIYHWHDNALHALDDFDTTDAIIEAADSWLVTDGRVLALEMHRDRFMASIERQDFAGLDTTGNAATGAAAFWDAALAIIPREGDWFPRVELQSRGGAALLVFRLRSAPERTRSVVVATWNGQDPRTTPRIKGPDLESMLRIRSAVQPLGAEEAIILSADGYVVDGAYSALLWWRGDILCGPSAELDRVGSVTARAVLTLATALGFDTHEESVTPAELDGCELWALSALHGIRIVTQWLGGPDLAEQPGRLATWRARLEALRKPL